MSTKANTNSALSPSTLLAQAYKCGEVEEKAKTTGTQTTAAAIFAAHSERESRRPQFHVYAERGQAFLDFKAEIIAAHVTPRMKSNEARASVVVANNAKNDAQMIMLNKGFDLAFALNAIGISLGSYVPAPTGGLFHLPVSTLITSDDTPLDTLAVAAKKGQLIPLDGKPYAYECGGKFSKFRASPARVLDLAGYKKLKRTTKAPTTKGANDTSTTGGTSAETIRADASTWSLDALLSAAADLLNKAADITTEGEAVSFADLPEATRNALNGIALFRDECLAVDASAKQEKAA